MSACATRGFAYGEKCQAAGRGVDAGGEAEASRMKCSQFICGLGDASQGRNDGYSDRREEAAACQVQLHAAASCRRGHGSCAAFDRKCGVKVHAAKKYAGRGIMLRRPENPASAKTARMIAAASSRAAAGSPAQREDSRRCHSLSAPPPLVCLSRLFFYFRRRDKCSSVRPRPSIASFRCPQADVRNFLSPTALHLPLHVHMAKSRTSRVGP